nr:bacterial transferase hexapeptide repeat-containing protein [Tanacetum cinerariifolium]
GVSVGPFCTVGPSAVLGNNCKLHPGSHVCGNTELGYKCILMSGAIVGDNLPGKTVIGCNNVIGHHAVVGIKCQDMKYKAELANSTSMKWNPQTVNRKIGIRSLRAAYKKIFMPTNVNLGGIEDRLDEVEQHQDLSRVPAVISLVQSIRESLREGRRGICKFRSWSFS